MTRVAAIVVNYEQAQLTQDCIESLLAQRSDVHLVIYCVDNGSGEACRESLQSWLSAAGPTCTPETASINWVSLTGNRGYSGGVNAALRLIGKQDVDFVWILNNDTMVHEQALDALLTCSRKHGDSALVGATIVDSAAAEEQQPAKIQCAGGCRFSPWSTFTRPNHQGAPLQQAASLPALELDFVFGASMFAPASLIKDVGLFDEDRFFLYCEELDYAHRARQLGYQLVWARSAMVSHEGGATTQSRSQARPEGSGKSFYFENLSALRLLGKHHKIALLPALTTRLCFKFGTALLLGRWAEFRQVVRAYTHFVTGRGWQQKPVEDPVVVGYKG